MLSLLKSRRSIRIFQNKEVEKEKVSEIIQAALLSPSSKDNNPWKFVIVDDSEILLKLSEAKEIGSRFLAKAPLAIVVLADPEKSDVWIEDSSIAATIIFLTAQSLGLGSCWVQMRRRKCLSGQQSSEEYLKNLLKIPDKYHILCVVAIGYSDEIKSEKLIPAQKVSDIFQNCYDKKYDFNSLKNIKK